MSCETRAIIKIRRSLLNILFVVSELSPFANKLVIRQIAWKYKSNNHEFRTNIRDQLSVHHRSGQFVMVTIQIMQIMFRSVTMV